MYKSGKEDLIDINNLAQASTTAHRAIFINKMKKIKEKKIKTEYFRPQTNDPYQGKLHLKRRNKIENHTRKNTHKYTVLTITDSTY